MMKLLKSFIKEERGSVVEYILVLAVVAVIIALAFPTLRTNMMDWFADTLGSMQKGMGGEGCDLATQHLVYDNATGKQKCVAGEAS